MQTLTFKHSARRLLASSGLILMSFISPPGIAEAEIDSGSSPSLVLTSPDLMSRYIAAEINAHRGHLKDALDDYYFVAQASLEPQVARRAARIALHLSSSLALEAVELWLRLEPGAIDAHQALVLLHVRQDRPQQALVAAQGLIQAATLAGKDGYLEIAAVATVSGDVDKAVALLEAVAKNNSQSAGSHYALGVAFFGMKEFARAEASLRQAIELNDKDARYWLLLSNLLSAQKRGSEAEKVLSEAVSHNPQERVLQLAYAGSLVEHGKYQAAFEVYRNLLQTEPDDPELLQAAGVLAMELGLWPEARFYLVKLIDNIEMRDQANLLLGKVELSLGHPDLASDYFNSVKGERQGEAIVQLAKIEIEAGRLESGHRLLEQQRLVHPEQVIDYYLAEAELLAAAKFVDEGVRLLLDAIELYPEDVDLRYAHGMLAVEQGDLATLEMRMRQIIEENPEHALALNALGYTLADETDRYAEALELISRALELMPDSPAILDSMGWVMFRLGRYEESIDYLQQAADKIDDGEIAAHLGEVLWHSGKRQQALQVWKSALEREPDNEHIVEAMKRLQP